MPLICARLFNLICVFLVCLPENFGNKNQSPPRNFAKFRRNMLPHLLFRIDTTSFSIRTVKFNGCLGFRVLIVQIASDNPTHARCTHGLDVIAMQAVHALEMCSSQCVFTGERSRCESSTASASFGGDAVPSLTGVHWTFLWHTCAR